jgi:predicted helicase
VKDHLVEIARAKLEQRIHIYFKDTLSDEEVRQVAPSLMTSSARYDAPATRQYLIRRGVASGYFVSYGYQPFDRRHLYWHPETTLLDRKREDLFPLFRAGNFFLTSRQKGERQNEGTPFYMTRHLPDWHLTRPGSICFPLTLNGLPSQMQTSSDEAAPTEDSPLANLSAFAHDYLHTLGISNPNADIKTAGLIWMHSLAIGYSPTYLTENADGIRQDWPRIPLPDSKEGLLLLN